METIDKQEPLASRELGALLKGGVRGGKRTVLPCQDKLSSSLSVRTRINGAALLAIFSHM